MPASASIRQLRRLIGLSEWQRDAVFVPVAIALLWGPHLAWAIDGWRRKHGGDIRRWLQTIGEFEAFSSLAAYGYEHPADPFPEIESSAAAVFDGRGLGHPLIANAHMVRNDVQFTLPTRLFVVSGSNMSGKSTLLRTVGVNTVLALAGAPVRAAQLRLSSFSIGATLRIQDSLLEGRSRFYAEITRIREVTDLTRGSRPVLFLLDELFHGTNSHDRLIGAAGVLSALLERGAIGLITTHDLALTAIAGQVGSAATNVHFEDWFEAGEIRFDYRMKPGPVTRSNAIALMQAVGLDVR
jgi:DNA mismatch repair ATPase MutS